MTDTRGDRTAQALSAFLVDRAHLQLPLSAELSETPSESRAHRGSSMAPAILPRSSPPGARRRRESPVVGDVVFYRRHG
jgi:hypothetical protein